VRGVPDAKWGQAVSAWIVVADSSLGVEADEVRKVVRDVLPDYCAPKFVHFVDRIPRSPLGKVLSSELPETSTR
ncbi:MAG: AMP-binding enzyme, partial [Actinomycetota bacterium]